MKKNNTTISAILSINEPKYDLFLLLWYVWRFKKDGKLETNKPSAREFGPTLKANLSPGEYVVTYQLGATFGEFKITKEARVPFEKSIDLNSGVLNTEVLLSKDAKPSEDTVVLCYPVELKKLKWLTAFPPYVAMKGQGLVIPANIDHELEGQIKDTDPHTHTGRIKVNVKPGEIKALTIIADKVGYR